MSNTKNQNNTIKKEPIYQEKFYHKGHVVPYSIGVLGATAAIGLLLVELSRIY